MILLYLIVVITCALALSWIMKKLNMPGLIGMMITGVIMGPYALDLISPWIIDISADLRQFALMVILARAGLALDIKTLKKVGKPAILMSFIPPGLEIGAVTIFAPMFLPITHLDAAIMGTVLSAVSPAIVVPRMLGMMKKRQGEEKGIPQLVMAATSVNGIFAIVLFTLLLWVEGSSTGSAMILRSAILPLVIVVVGAVILRYFHDFAARLSKVFSKIWLPTEIMLFVLVGAAINVSYVAGASVAAITLITVATFFRICCVPLCLIGTGLNFQEKVFCAIAYLPKATVQAAIGGTALAVGMETGHIILIVAVLAILITAPLGAIGIDFMCFRFFGSGIKEKTTCPEEPHLE